jgi:hypothetical protein
VSEGDATAGDQAGAAVGAVIPIQGRLTDASGSPLNGDYSITASIYDTSTGGVALCSETDTKTVTNGLFNMNLSGCSVLDISGDDPSPGHLPRALRLEPAAGGDDRGKRG